MKRTPEKWVEDFFEYIGGGWFEDIADEEFSTFCEMAQSEARREALTEAADIAMTYASIEGIAQRIAEEIEKVRDG